MIKKFYDTAVAEPAGGSPSIAQLMATHGVMNSTEETVATPIVLNTEKKEEPQKPAEDSPAVTATEPSNGAKANLETPSPEKPIEQTPIPQKEEMKAQQVQWQEVLRNQQPDTVLKELGYDEKAVSFLKDFNSLDPKMQAFLNVWKTNGDVKEYLREMTTDYEKMSAEEVMRHQLRQEYPKASQQQLEALYRREVIKAYSLDSEDEDELNEGKALLEAKADKYRETFINGQKDKLLPKAPPPVDNSAEEAKALEAEKQRIEAYKSQFNNNSSFKEINNSKAYSFGDGDEKFNYPVSPNDLQEILFTEKWQDNMFNSDGTPNVEHQLLVATVNKYGINFIKELAKHFKSVGGNKAIEPIENASKPDMGTPSPAEAPPKSAAEAMARFGRLS